MAGQRAATAILFSLLVLCPGIEGAPVQPQIDWRAVPQVVGLFSCTGVAVSPHKVWTAAHCARTVGEEKKIRVEGQLDRHAYVSWTGWPLGRNGQPRPLVDTTPLRIDAAVLTVQEPMSAWFQTGPDPMPGDKVTIPNHGLMQDRAMAEGEVQAYIEQLSGWTFAVSAEVFGGASGAPVLSGGKVVGVVSRHNVLKSEGCGPQPPLELSVRPCVYAAPASLIPVPQGR